MTSRKRRFIFIFFAFFLGFIFFTEIFLRIVYKEKLKTRIYPLIYQPDSNFGFKYIPNIKGEISVPGIHKNFTINSNGYYGKDFSRQKDNDKYRIAIVATSEGTGIWLNGPDNFSIILQRMFDEKHINAEVINFSMDGQIRELSNVNLVNKEIINYKPDLVLLNTNFPFIKSSFRKSVYRNYVIIYNGDNDLSEKWCRAKIDYIESNKIPIFIYNISYISRAICRYFMNHYRNYYSYNLTIFIEKRLQAPDIRFIPFSMKHSLDILKSTRENLQSINCDFALFSYMNTDSATKDFVNKMGLIKYIFLNIPNDPSMSYNDDSHFNEKAQNIIAQYLMAKFEFDGNKIVGIKE